MDFSKIKNLLFDLGAVIINIDIDITFKAFADRMNISVQDVMKLFENNSFWNDYETGKVKDDDFVNYIKDNFNNSLSQQEIHIMWNKLLLDIPLERIELIKRLSKKYRLFVLSNTNFLHIQRVNEILYAASGIRDIKDLFEKVYYSYELNLRKPDPEIYKYVLKDKSLIAEETLFLDDNRDNIGSASKLGIHTIHVQAPQTIIELLSQA